MNRKITVAFAIVAALLAATAPVAAQHDTLVVASIHDDFGTDNESNPRTLTNASVVGSGSSAYVNYDVVPLYNPVDDEGDGGLNGDSPLFGDDDTDSPYKTELRMKPTRNGTITELTYNITLISGSDYGTTVDVYIVPESPDGVYAEGTLVKDDYDPDWVEGKSTIDITNYDVTAGQDYSIEFVTNSSDSDASFDNAQIGVDGSASSTWVTVNGNNKQVYADIAASYKTERSSARYVSADHSASKAEEGFVNLTLENASADVRWEYYDGSAWQLANSSTFSTTGNHTLDVSGVSSETWRVDVTFNNQSGATTGEIHDEGILFDARAPTLSNASPEDGSKLDSKSTQFEVQVNDSDFGTAQGEEVQLQWYIDGNQEGTTTATSNGTYSFDPGTLTGGDHDWYVEADDSYNEVTTSKTRSFKVPERLYIYNETRPSELVNGTNSTVTVRFFADDTIVTRNTTTGEINMTGLPADKKISIRAEADGYYSRRIIIDDLYSQQEIYLLNSSYSDVAEVRFKVSDQTGQFDEPEVLIEKPIEKGGNTTWKRIVGDDTGVAGLTTNLDKNARYRIIVRQGSNSRMLGSYTNPISETVDLQVGSLSFEHGNASGYLWDATYQNQTGSHQIQFNYSDSDNQTENLEVVIYERGNESNELVTKSYSGPVGEVSFTEPITENESENTWVVNFTAERGGEQISGEVLAGKQRALGTGLADIWLHSLSVGLLIVVAGLFGGLNARVGAIVVPLLAGIFWFLGMLPAAVGAGVIILALAIAIFYNVNSSRGVPS